MAQGDMVDYATGTLFAKFSSTQQQGPAKRIFVTDTLSGLVIYRGFDSGRNQYVTWLAQTLTPLNTDTTPNYTGVLSDVHIEVP